MARTVTTNQLNPGDTFVVEGTVGFSRITAQLTGEALEQDKIRRTQRGFQAIDRPYTTMTLHNAVYRPADPNNKTPLDIYIEESLYTSKSEGASGFSFSAYNKGNSLPWVAVKNGDRAEQIRPLGELAQGLRVAVMCRVFKAPRNNGISLDGVVILEEPRYYQTNDPTEALKSLQLNFVPDPTIDRQVHPDTQVAPHEENHDGYDQGTPQQTYQPQPQQPMAQPDVYGDPNITPFSSNGQTGYDPHPQGNPYPAPQQPYQPYAPGMNQPSVAPMPDNPLGQAGGGIRYNPQGNGGY